MDYIFAIIMQHLITMARSYSKCASISNLFACKGNNWGKVGGLIKNIGKSLVFGSRK